MSSRKSAWAVLPVERKIQLLWQMHDIMRSIDHQQWARDSCAAALIPDDESKELNIALDMVIAVLTLIPLGEAGMGPPIVAPVRVMVTAPSATSAVAATTY